MGRIPLMELKIPRFPFHVFWKILIPYSRFSRSDKTNLKDFPACVFPKNKNDVRGFEVSKSIFPKMIMDFFLDSFE